MPEKKARLTKSDFDAIAADLAHEIEERLRQETKPTSEINLDDDGDTDLWELPVVDSKTVIKTSGIVKKYLGISLPPRMIHAGGYPSIEDAVKDILPKLRELCQESGPLHLKLVEVTVQ